jgi:hypothetical protein
LENQVLTKIEKTTQAVLALFASFYVYHITFTPGTHTLFQFFEHIILTCAGGQET